MNSEFNAKLELEIGRANTRVELVTESFNEVQGLTRKKIEEIEKSLKEFEQHEVASSSSSSSSAPPTPKPKAAPTLPVQ
jgi:hypothetical protein